MTTERIDIVVNEKGSRVVRKNVQDIGGGARDAASGVDILNRALKGLGIALAVREVLKSVDVFNNLQNRLRSTGLEGKNLTGVYKELLKVANETRSSVEGSVELYSRLALSSKELGVSQRDLIDFTKSLNQAILLSGASAEEAQAGLIQLSQGMASGTLRGDELRSVLEQLPAVADVIAKHLGVTRGQLRQLGQDGKITAKDILAAFKEARGELDDRFGKSVPTIAQSFQVLKNAVVDMAGDFNKATGFTTILSKALMFMAANLPTIAKSLVAVASGFVLIGGASAAIDAARKAVLALNLAIAANPVGFLLTILTSAISALILFRDQIKLGTNDTTTLGDLMRATWEKISAGLKQVWEAAKALFEPLISLIEQWVGKIDFSLAGIIRFVAKAIDFQINAWATMINVVIAYWRGFGPAVADLVTSALNVILGKIGDFVNAAGKLLSSLTEFAGLGKIAAVDFKLTNENEGAAKKLGSDIGDAIKNGMKGSRVQDFVQGIFDRADEIGAKRVKDAADAAGAVSDAKSPATAVATAGDKDKKKKVRDLAEELKNLVSQYDRVYAAQQELKKATELLDKAEAAGLITSKRKAEVLGLINEQLKDQLDPLGAVNRELDKQLDLLKMTTDAREIEAQVRSTVQDLQAAGIKLNETELKQLRDKLTLIQEQTKLDQAVQSMRSQTQGGRNEDFDLQKQALARLQKSGDATSADSFNIINSMLGGTLDNSKAAFDAQFAQFDEYYARVQQLRADDLINAQQAADAMNAIDSARAKFMVDRVAGGLGQIAQLMGSHNKTAFRIGQAAAIAEVAVKTPQAAMDAYSSLAGIPYVGPFLGAAAAAAAVAYGAMQISQIRSQQPPQYRLGGEYVVGGHGGVDSQNVAFRATPGERISINTPQQAHAMQNVERMLRDDNRSGGKGGVTINQTIVQQGRPDRKTPAQNARLSAKESRKAIRSTSSFARTN